MALGKLLKDPADLRFVWIIWGALMIGMGVVGAVTIHTVTGAYELGAERWLAGEMLYDTGIHGFLYLPQSAMLYAPMTMLPEAIGAFVWRVLMIGILAAGCFAMSREVKRWHDVELFPIMTLVSLPIVLDGARNGQMTLGMTGVMLLSMAALSGGKYWQMTLWLMLGLAMKPLMLVMILLVGGVYLHLVPRLLAGMLVLLGLPFVFKGYEYVLAQYAGFGDMLLVAGDPSSVAPFDYCDVFGMLRVFGVDVALGGQMMGRLIVAAIVFGVCWVVARVWGRKRGAVMILIGTAGYLMLFNPRVEANTYGMLGPVFGLLAGWAFVKEGATMRGWLLVVMMLLIAGNYELTKLITPGKTIWLPPMVCGLLMVYVFVMLMMGRLPGGGGKDVDELAEEAEVRERAKKQRAWALLSGGDGDDWGGDGE
ncbi:glycosyltransferase family 87 protein [Poriferisphaera sp. WC338]|uniref:glycosyltransferase family 87 protein n=1 Tax=Poriferisphaera sp. WC338 TaxID=3425129 RepID=UPI003D816900